mmetsp:Transcript_78594/g.172273  ORF Transcript_78594/g.172273 Transcript_78594/m.172273 type:complete len:239 (-) Transcript_78594:1214-1930(-)
METVDEAGTKRAPDTKTTLWWHTSLAREVPSRRFVIDLVHTPSSFDSCDLSRCKHSSSSPASTVMWCHSNSTLDLVFLLLAMPDIPKASIDLLLPPLRGQGLGAGHGFLNLGLNLLLHLFLCLFFQKVADSISCTNQSLVVFHPEPLKPFGPDIVPVVALVYHILVPLLQSWHHNILCDFERLVDWPGAHREKNCQLQEGRFPWAHAPFAAVAPPAAQAAEDLRYRDLSSSQSLFQCL